MVEEWEAWVLERIGKRMNAKNAKKRKKSTPIEDFLSRSVPRREEAAAEFDREFVADTFGPLSRESEKLWKKAKGKRLPRSM